MGSLCTKEDKTPAWKREQQAAAKAKFDRREVEEKEAELMVAIKIQSIPINKYTDQDELDRFQSRVHAVFQQVMRGRQFAGSVLCNHGQYDYERLGWHHDDIKEFSHLCEEEAIKKILRKRILPLRKEKSVNELYADENVRAKKFGFYPGSKRPEGSRFSKHMT